jgi:acyl-CoA reductase-like NAD-dependent aldehyde dehydrogenase
MTPDQAVVEKCYVGGEWIDTGARFEVRSPFSGELVASLAQAGRAEAQRAVDAAQRALEAPLPQWRRADLLERVSELIAERAEDLAQSICAEGGKPLKAARVEVQRAVGTYALSAAEARRLAGEVVPVGGTEHGSGHVAWTVRVPVGVIGAISPFNFPLNLVAHKVAPALAAGCPVVLKPASQTPVTALRLAAICEDAGLPPGWLNVIPGKAAEIGDVLVEDERVRMITFTGSAETGWNLKRRAATKKVTLELGNSSPMIVAADADLELVAAKIARHAFSNAGQTCVSVQRVYVDQSAIRPLRDLLKPKVEALVVGDPRDETTDVGPVIDRDNHERVLEWIDQAVQGGATVLTGGPHDSGVIAPTVLDGVKPEMRVCRDEVFGPVCSLIAVGSVDEALELANATEFGLQASIFTSRIDVALAAVERLEFGSVLINEATEWRTDAMPYGGVKASGNTKEGPAYTVREMTEERLVVLAMPVPPPG